MKTKIIEFTECEHEADLQAYVADLIDSGARVIASPVCDSDAEVGEVKVEIDDEVAFLDKFRKTDSFGFSSLNN